MCIFVKEQSCFLQDCSLPNARKEQGWQTSKWLLSFLIWTKLKQVGHCSERPIIGAFSPWYKILLNWSKIWSFVRYDNSKFLTTLLSWSKTWDSSWRIFFLMSSLQTRQINPPSWIFWKWRASVKWPFVFKSNGWNNFLRQFFSPGFFPQLIILFIISLLSVSISKSAISLVWKKIFHNVIFFRPWLVILLLSVG